MSWTWSNAAYGDDMKEEKKSRSIVIVVQINSINAARLNSWPGQNYSVVTGCVIGSRDAWINILSNATACQPFGVLFHYDSGTLPMRYFCFCFSVLFFCCHIHPHVAQSMFFSTKTLEVVRVNWKYIVIRKNVIDFFRRSHNATNYSRTFVWFPFLLISISILLIIYIIFWLSSK